MTRSTWKWEESRWLSFVVALVFGAATVGVAAQLQKQNLSHTNEVLDRQIQNMAAALEHDLQLRIADLRRMAKEWELRQGIPQREWETIIGQYIIDRPGLQAIEWVDKDNIVRWIVPLEGNEAALNLALNFEERRAEGLQSALKSKTFTMAGPIDLVQGGLGVLGYLPLWNQGEGDGFLLTVFRIPTWLHHVWSKLPPSEIFVIVQDKSGEIFTSDLTGNSANTEWIRTAKVSIANLVWWLKIYPSPTFIAKHQSALPGIVLGSGLLLTLLLGIGVHLLQLTTRRKVELQTLTQNLTQEIHHGRIVEGQLSKNEQWFRKVFDESPASMRIFDPQGIVLDVNPAFCQLVGYTREELIGQTFLFTHHDDLENDLSLKKELIEGKRSRYSFEKRLSKKNGEWIWVNVTGCVLRNHAVKGLTLMELIEDISERKQNDAILTYLSQGVPGGSSEEFFSQLLHHVTQAIGIEHAFIAKHSHDREMMGTLAVLTNGQHTENFEYDLARTPCESVMEKGFCVYPEGIQELFPENWFPQDWKVNSFIGVPLVSLEGKSIGLMVGLGTKVIHNPDRVRDVFMACAPRLAWELERMEEDTDLKEGSKLAMFEAQISHMLIQGEDIQHMLQGCTDVMVRHLDAAFARIWTLNESTHMLELQASSGLYTHLNGPHSRVPVGQLKIGRIASERKPLFTNNVVTDPHVSDHEWARREGMVAFAGLPLLIDGRVLGVMAIFARQPLTVLMYRLQEGIADQIALGIERKHAEQALLEQKSFLRQVLDSNPNFIFAKDFEGRFTLVNQAMADAYGTTAHAMIGKIDADFHPHAKEVESFRQTDLSVMNSGQEQVVFEEPFTDSVGKVHWLQTVKRPLVGIDGRPQQVLGVSTDLTEYRQTEQILRTLVDATSTVTSTNFFFSLVSCLSSVLQVRYVFLAECTDETNSRVRTLAFMKGDAFGPTMEYELKGTPCQHVIEGELVYHPRDVQAVYPEDQCLADWEVQCYLGIPLYNSGGIVIGQLALLNETTFDFNVQTESLLKVFAARAGAELERLIAERALQQSEARLQAVLDGSSSVIYIKDLDGRYQLINRQFEELFHLKREAVQGWTDSDIFPQNIALAFQLNDHKVISTRVPQMFEEIAPHPDGPHTYISNKFLLHDADGVPYATCGISTDITIRKRAEALLKESESRFRVMADSAPVMIWMAEVDGACHFFNRGWLEFRGKNVEEEKGYGWTKGIHPDDCQLCLESYRQACSHQAPFQIEFRLRYHDGKYRWVLNSGAPRLSPDGTFAGLIGSCVDINQRKLKEELFRTIEISQKEFITTADPAKSFGILLEQLTSLTESSFGFIGEVLWTEEGKKYLKTHAISNIAWNEETQTLYNRFAPNLEFYNLDTLFGAVITSGQVVLANNPSTDPRSAGFPKGHPPIHAFLGLPIYHGEHLVGMVGIANRSGGYSQDIVEFLHPLLVSCGLVVDAYQQAQRWKLIQDSLKISEDARQQALEKRTQLSQDLHDHILQSLYAVGMIFASTKKPFLEADMGKGIAQLDQGVNQLNLTIGEIRQFIRGLNQEIESEGNFYATLMRLKETLGKWFSNEFIVDIDQNMVSELSHEQEFHLSNIVREAMSNTLRHGRATKAWVRLRHQENHLQLEIGDDGVGFDQGKIPKGIGGHGLKNMKARVEYLKGSLEILSTPQEGLRILINLPTAEDVS